MEPLDAPANAFRDARHRLVDVPAAGFLRQLQHFVVVEDRMRHPLLLQRRDRPEQLLLPLAVLRERIVHDEKPVVRNRRHFGDHRVDRARAELAAAQERRAARKAFVLAAARRMDQVHHLHAAEVVERPVQDVPAGGPDQPDVRRIAQIVVDGLQCPGLGVGDHRLHAAFGLAQEDAVRVGLRLFRMQHGRDAAEQHLHAAGAIGVGDFPCARDLAGQHHRHRHQIGGVRQIQRLHVFVHERDGHVRRQGRRKANRAVRGQMEFGLVPQLRPAGIDQFQLHRFSFSPSVFPATTKARASAGVEASTTTASAKPSASQPRAARRAAAPEPAASAT